ncbi:hypothetical protein Vi05172_g13234 [Venturia inaequalis]|nr:hypothetical protein Vi05172_g13234 [Venturia inaequalis]
MAPKKRELAKAAAGPKHKLPAQRRRAKQEKKTQIISQAIVPYSRATRSKRQDITEAAFKPANKPSTLRRPKLPNSVANSNGIKYNQEQATSKDELVIIRSDVSQSPPVTPRTPQRQTPQRRIPVAQFGLLTPPNSGSSSKIQKTVKKTISKKKVSNFQNKLAAAYRADEVVITGTQVNTKPPKHHLWTADERKVLCVIKRFFSADNYSLTAILNGIFPKALIPFTIGMVRSQYTEIRAGKKQTGVESDEVWSAVWDVSDFNTACQNFKLILEKLEETASEVGVPLSRRLEEDLTNVTYTESRKVAVQNRPVKVVREAPNTGRRMTGSRQTISSPTVRQQDGTGQASQQLVARNQTEALTDLPSIEDPTLDETEIQPDSDVPTLLFRAFSSVSAGLNSEERFRAGQYIGRSNAVPPPPDPSDTQFAWDASNHLSQSHEIASKIATPFISLSPSLVWCVQRLYKMAGEEDSKKFAIIIGPVADAHTRLYRVEPILQHLKNTGMYNKNVSYKATMEYFAWAEIPKAAITTTIHRHHLERLAHASPCVTALLRLATLQNTPNMSEARAHFKAHPVPLDGRSGMALAKICLLFGISYRSDQAGGAAGGAGGGSGGVGTGELEEEEESEGVV